MTKSNDSYKCDSEEYPAVNKNNQIIVNEFCKLIYQIKFEIDTTTSKKDKFKNSFRLSKVQDALKIVMKFNKKINAGKDLEHIKGIGKGTISRIDEIIKKGKLSEIKLSGKNQNIINDMEELEKVHGIGNAKAKEFVMKYNIRTIEQLKQAFIAGKIELTNDIILGLKYFGQYQMKIPRQEITDIDEYVHKIIYKVDSDFLGVICGSYRRLKMTSNDIDILLVHPKVITLHDLEKSTLLHTLIKELNKEKFIVDALTGDDVVGKFMGFCKFLDNPVRRIDIRFLPYESYYAALLYFTGSGDFNRRMRQVAKLLGYKLNEYGLFDENNIPVKINSEEHIFQLLGMEYVLPENRI